MPFVLILNFVLCALVFAGIVGLLAWSIASSARDRGAAGATGSRVAPALLRRRRAVAIRRPTADASAR